MKPLSFLPRLALAACLWLSVLNPLPLLSLRADTPEAEEDSAPAKDSSAQKLIHRHEVIQMGGDVLIRSNEVAEIVVVIHGDAVIEGKVNSQVVVVGGSANINGEVGGVAVAVLGGLRLGPSAKIGGQAVGIGSGLDKAAGAKVGGEIVDFNIKRVVPILEPILAWGKSGLLLGRPLPPSVGFAWWIVAIHFSIYLIVFLLLPKAVGNCATAVGEKPVITFLVGLLVFLLLGPLVTVLAATVVGLLLVPFLFLVLLGGILLGKTAMFEYLGRQFLGRFASTPNAFLCFLLGNALVILIYMVPVLGFVFWAVLIPWALGSCAMAAVAAFPKPQSPPTPATYLVTPTPAPVDPARASFIAQPPLASADTLAGSAQAISLAPAGFWIRFLATLLDLILLIWLVPMTERFFIFLWASYHVGMWVWKGTTIGGIVCSLRVVRTDGRPMDFTVALVRALASVFSALPLFLGFFWAGWSRERQSWHDKIAGTVIVRTPKGMSLL